MVQKMVRVDDEQMAELQNYSAKSGVAVAQAVREALSDYLMAVVPSRLRALERSAKRPKLVKK